MDVCFIQWTTCNAILQGEKGRGEDEKGGKGRRERRGEGRGEDGSKNLRLVKVQNSLHDQRAQVSVTTWAAFALTQFKLICADSFMTSPSGGGERYMN